MIGGFQGRANVSVMIQRILELRRARAQCTHDRRPAISACEQTRASQASQPAKRRANRPANRPGKQERNGLTQRVRHQVGPEFTAVSVVRGKCAFEEFIHGFAEFVRRGILDLSLKCRAVLWGERSGAANGQASGAGANGRSNAPPEGRPRAEYAV